MSEKSCERCGEPADFQVRAIETVVHFYLCKGCMQKPDISEWIREQIKKDMDAWKESEEAWKNE